MTLRGWCAKLLTVTRLAKPRVLGRNRYVIRHYPWNDPAAGTPAA
jgi:hypothetical protein